MCTYQIRIHTCIDRHRRPNNWILYVRAVTPLTKIPDSPSITASNLVGSCRCNERVDKRRTCTTYMRFIWRRVYVKVPSKFHTFRASCSSNFASTRLCWNAPRHCETLPRADSRPTPLKCDQVTPRGRGLTWPNCHGRCSRGEINALFDKCQRDAAYADRAVHPTSQFFVIILCHLRSFS